MKKSVFQRAQGKAFGYVELTKTEFRKLVKAQRIILERRDCSQRQAMHYSGIRI